MSIENKYQFIEFMSNLNKYKLKNQRLLVFKLSDRVANQPRLCHSILFNKKTIVHICCFSFCSLFSINFGFVLYKIKEEE